MYNVKSMDANEFIDDAEVLDSISEAKKLVRNKAEVERILDKASKYKGLTHREVAVLLEVDDDETLEKMYKVARYKGGDLQKKKSLLHLYTFRVLCKQLQVLRL